MKRNHIIFLVHDFDFSTMMHNISMTLSILLVSIYEKVFTARNVRMGHNDRLVRVRMHEPCCIATNAAIAR